MKKLISILLIVSMLASLGVMSTAYSGYSDVSNDTWYYDSVKYVTEKGLFNGTSDSAFSPGGTMTRAMFVTVLGRYANISSSVQGFGIISKAGVNMRSSASTDSSIVAVLDKGTNVYVTGKSGDWYKVLYSGKSGYIRNDLISVTGNSKFTDVPYGQYYSAYIQWAYDEALVSGTTETTFSPESGVTREQICTILYNYSTKSGLTLPKLKSQVIFTDDAQISSWAKDSVYALQQAGVISGRTNGGFDPSATATRAEVAALLAQFVSAIETTTPVPTPSPSPSPTPTPTPSPSTSPDTRPVYPETEYNGYTLSGNIVHASASVSDSYFNDACFIGHSIVSGMEMYFSLPNADFYAVNGIAASTMLKYDQFTLSTTHLDEDGETVNDTGTLEQVLNEKSGEYSKVYIMLGTNELGPETYHASTYYSSMRTLVSIVKKTQPNAKIYLIATIPVSRDRSIHNLNYTRDNILTFNTKLMQLSVVENVYYIDAFSVFANENGYLPESYCLEDGIHILKPQYAQLKSYLKTHT